jgi:hypothetical protein
MKKIIFCFIVPAMVMQAQTQGVPTGVRVSPTPEVPAIITDRFRQDHKNVNATWNVTGDRNFEASFAGDSTHRQVQEVYSSTGEFLRRRAQLDKGWYPQMIDQYYITNYPLISYAIWREDKRGADTSYFGIQGPDTLWFGKDGNYLQDKNRLRGRTLLSEKDRAYLVDISIANVERISTLSHVNDSSKVISKELLAGRYAQIDQQVRRFGAAKNIPLPEPMLPVGRIREPGQKDFRRMDKRFLKALQKTNKKATDQELKTLARNLMNLENGFARQGEGAPK